MMIEGDMVLTGTMNVDQTTRVEGELSGDGTMIVDGTLSIEYDVCGSVTLKAERIYIEGDVDGEVTLDAREVTIEGDRGKDVKIMNAEKLVIEGEDLAEKDRREKLSMLPSVALLVKASCLAGLTAKLKALITSCRAL